jgi:flagellar hook assembly protein FlgD
MLALALAVLAPGTAAAQDVRVVARDVSLGAAHSSAAREAPLSFTMVGVHWQGSGKVWFRTAATPGRFGPWRPAQPEGEDRPDAGSDELAASAGWRVGNPWWTGRAHWIQYRVSGEVTRLRAFFVDSPVTDADRERAPAPRTAALAAEVGPVPRPPMTMRAGWNADETIVRGAPSIADRLRVVTVHHTAGSNSYSRSSSAAIVRGIQRYHVLSNGWDDIGYNFLVDKYGQVFEGRAGGITRNVVGAHAGGFNTGSVGIAVIGNYQSASFSAAARNALEDLLAWRLDVGHVHPRGVVSRVSAGSSKWPAGAVVRLRAVSGHRDTSLTSCPGNRIYSRLDSVARRARDIGLPKLWSPEAEGGVGGLVRFTARLSSARAWTVEVKDAAGTVVASGSGSSTTVDWTWDATSAPIIAYTYTISAGANVRPATYPVPGPPPLAVTRLGAKPSALTPNGDGSGELIRVSFGLTRRALLGVRVLNASGTSVRTLLASASRPAGPFSLSWDGRTGGGALVPDGRYRIEVSAEDGPEDVTRTAPVVVDRTLGGLAATPAVVSPNGDGRVDTLAVGYELTRTATVEVKIRRSGKLVRTLLDRPQDAGAHTIGWNGRLHGRAASDGTVTVRVTAETSLGKRRLERSIRLDTRDPVVTVRSLKRVNGLLRLRLRLSEAADLAIRYGQSGPIVRTSRPAGNVTIRRDIHAKVVRIVATDAGLNRSRAVVYRR